MHAVWMVRFYRRGPKPEIVIQFGRHRLRREVSATAPDVLLPIKARGAAEGDLERPAKHAGLHQFLDGLHWYAHAIKRTVEPEPGVEAENPFMLRHGGLHGFALGNRPGHGFLTPDVLASLGGGDGNHRMPVRWRGHVNDVNVLAGQNFSEILVAFHIRTTGLEA